jgi:beta-lactamase superfamily II metal-dependent hydrolase
VQVTDQTGSADQVTVSVLHGSFDGAGYALMVGVYNDEEMSGAERFLDRQFGQLLSGWQDLGHYPGPLGTSVFIEPGRDVPVASEPVGAYLVGLGSSLTLGPRQLRFAAYRALIDRCLRLYRPNGGAVGGRPGVGVSTALLGVRDDAGLRIEDSVTAILEGVRDVNRRLTEYEHARGRRTGVGVRHVQFVERYAHRADLAAAAVRRGRSTAALPDTFIGLEDVCVEKGDGALPAGAAVLEQDRSWTRFAVTERASRHGVSVIEVTALGPDARADRVTHQIDRASLDALTTRLTGDRSDSEALQALRDRLIPYDLRAEFLGSAHLQLVVNECAARYSWEQFAAPAPDSDGDARRAGVGSILRAFTESDDRRLQPVRATVNTALVIGAGNTTPGAPLDAAVAEAKEIGALLRAGGIELPEVLTDEQGPLTLDELNIKLLGNHQILHLAGHGTDVEGDMAASGVLLARDFRFSADFVDSMTIVPELVVLNSCYNARIGLNRLAAGLARTLMRIGVRAVVAAGWPIGDRAARTFAHAFHADMLAGRTFGDAVARARREAARHDGNTWAAYQCYGDPTFMLRGRTAGLNRFDRPVSLSDLQTRLETFLVQVADLSRPRPESAADRRDQLVEQFRQLEDWAQEYNPDGTPQLRRQLAQVARDLGEFDRAAHWYSTFATDAGDPGSGAKRPADRRVPAEVLQQAANCTARGAQSRHRRQAGAPALDSSFAEAAAFANGALTAVADDEGAAILASVYQKWATVFPSGPDQDRLLAHAVEAYSRIRSTTRGDYGVDNRIQAIALRNPAEAREQLERLQEAEPSAAPTAPADQAGLADGAPPRGKDFWARAVDGDRKLTTLMTATTAERRSQAAEGMLTDYLGAFRQRSTYAERYSSIDHLDDLHCLLPDDDARKSVLRDSLDRLESWRGFAPQEGSTVSTPASAAPVIRSSPSGRQTVRLTAMHAACGDCLLLEYTDGRGQGHRILIDGGLGTAFDEGLGRQLGTSDTPTAVDIAVVTHVDSDHIEGIIRALREGRLTADDYWFNGRDQATRPNEPEATRSLRQGDALSRLIPDGRRNRVVDGQALMVRDDGPPEIALPGGATAVLLSPTPERLAELARKWPEPARDGDGIDALLRAFQEDSDRGPGTFGRDNSVPNGTSIAFLFEHAGASILLTGDAWAPVLASSIKALLERRNRSRPKNDPLTALPIQLFKLSHHGSRQNITDELLDVVIPEQILVCTDGSKFSHPDADAMAMVRRHYPDVPIHFTDTTDVIRDRALQVDASLPAASPVVIQLQGTGT